MPADLATFDTVVRGMYRDGFSTYEAAAALGVSQGKIARSLRRSGTRRRTHQQAQLLELSTPKMRGISA